MLYQTLKLVQFIHFRLLIVTGIRELSVHCNPVIDTALPWNMPSRAQLIMSVLTNKPGVDPARQLDFAVCRPCLKLQTVNGCDRGYSTIWRIPT